MTGKGKTMSPSGSSSSDGWWSSWSDAHSRSCRNLNSLHASPRQVLEYTRVNVNVKMLMIWSLPRHGTVVEWNSPERVEAVCKSGTGVVTTPTKPPPPVDLSTTPTPVASKGMLRSVAETVLSPLLSILTPARPSYPMGDELDDDAFRSWNSTLQEEDDAHRDLAIKKRASTLNGDHSEIVGWEVSILNTALTQECLDQLGSAVALQGNSDGTFPKIIPRRRTATAGQRNSWMQWIQENVVDRSLLGRLSDSEHDFLLECLSKREKVCLVSTGKEELVILAPPLQDENADAYKQVLASWWELTMALESLEARRQQWSNQADEWANKALQEKRQQPKRGLTSFKLHKLFAQRLEQSEGMLLNLEQARHALEESWHQRQVVQALEASAQTLQTLRQQREVLDDVDNLMETYREELDNVAVVQQSLAFNEAVYDEEDLLKELDGLTLQDKEQTKSTDSSNGSNTEETSVTKNPSEFSTLSPSEEMPESSKQILGA